MLTHRARSVSARILPDDGEAPDPARSLPEPGSAGASLREVCPGHIQVYTLGRFSIVRGGEPIRFKTKAQRMPMNLLKALIAFGGREVPVERLSDALWSESQGDLARQALAVTLCRLRKLIGEAAVRRQEGRLSLERAHCWVDCWAFERLVNGGASTLASVFPTVATLYRGSFLRSEDDRPWIIPTRERLHSKLVQFVLDCGRELYHRGEHKQALQVYQRGIEIEDGVEDFYRRLMGVYVALEQPSKRCCRTGAVKRCCGRVGA